MSKIKLRFIKPWAKFKVGDEVMFDQSKGNRRIAEGLAILVEEKKKVEPKVKVQPKVEIATVKPAAETASAEPETPKKRGRPPMFGKKKNDTED